MDIRLKKQKDFDLVFNKSKRVYSNSLTIIFLKKGTTKIGISLSKKFGKAVLRNRIKRLIRASIREYVSLFNDTYYIVILPKIALEYTYNNFVKDLKYTLKKGGIIND